MRLARELDAPKSREELLALAVEARAEMACINAHIDAMFAVRGMLVEQCSDPI